MGWFVQLLNKFTTLTVNGFFSDKLDLAVFLFSFFICYTSESLVDN